MKIVKDALAGTLESSDLQVKVSPHPEHRLEVALQSAVMAQFGKQLRAVIDETLHELKVTEGLIVVEDKGALDCAVRARLQAAVQRGTDGSIAWEALP